MPYFPVAAQQIILKLRGLKTKAISHSVHGSRIRLELRRLNLTHRLQLSQGWDGGRFASKLTHLRLPPALAPSPRARDPGRRA